MKTLKRFASARLAGLAVGLAAGLASVPALAHPAGDAVHGLGAGLAHPFLGLDHLLAMVAVGLLAGQSRATLSRAAAPLAFISALLAGAGLAFAGVALPLVEPAILVSLLVLGGLLIAATALPVWLAPLLAGLFGLFHGHAHGSELAADASAMAYAVGFVTATALLHGAGFVLALLAQRLGGANSARRMSRVAGAAIAAAGGLLAIG